MIIVTPIGNHKYKVTAGKSSRVIHRMQISGLIIFQFPSSNGQRSNWDLSEAVKEAVLDMVVYREEETDETH